MTRTAWVAPLVMAPFAALGLWLWLDQATMIWLSDFVQSCF